MLLAEMLNGLTEPPAHGDFVFARKGAGLTHLIVVDWTEVDTGEGNREISIDWLPACEELLKGVRTKDPDPMTYLEVGNELQCMTCMQRYMSNTAPRKTHTEIETSRKNWR